MEGAGDGAAGTQGAGDGAAGTQEADDGATGRRSIAFPKPWWVDEDDEIGDDEEGHKELSRFIENRIQTIDAVSGLVRNTKDAEDRGGEFEAEAIFRIIRYKKDTLLRMEKGFQEWWEGHKRDLPGATGTSGAAGTRAGRGAAGTERKGGTWVVPAKPQEDDKDEEWEEDNNWNYHWTVGWWRWGRHVFQSASGKWRTRRYRIDKEGFWTRDKEFEDDGEGTDDSKDAEGAGNDGATGTWPEEGVSRARRKLRWLSFG